MMNKDLPIRAGVFENEPAADRAVTGLLAAGFHKDKISVVTSRSVLHHAEHEDVESVDPAGSNTKGAMALGGAIGSVLGGLTAAVGVVATGGVGLLIVGPLIVGAASGGVAGGFVGAMMTRGLEPEIADYYDQAMQKGQFLVAVEASDDGPSLDSAEAVFERSGAVSIPMHKS